MSMEEIEKLRMRVEKNPNSRLFLPLSEEYRKSGMVDEAISIILRGLERQPDYTSARVALGRLYLEKNMIEEARNEFEKVVSVIPDNLFSHKKLAEIYRGCGEIQKAIAEYRKVLQLNPLDNDAKQSLQEIEGVPSEEAESVISSGNEDEEAIQAELCEVPMSAEHEGEEEISVEPLETFDEKFEEFKTSFSGIDEEEIAEIEEETDSKSGIDLSIADSFILSGNYFKALEIFREVLKNDPGNKHILQRIAELKALMRMMGKSEEMMIAKLETFLDAIRKGFSRES